MATDSKRIKALQGTVTTIQSANGAGQYWNDLSGTNQVTTLVQPKSTLFNMPYGAWVWVHDGIETYTANSATDLTYESELEILCDVLVRDTSSDQIVEELNKAVQDVVWAIGTDNTLNSSVNDAWIVSIDEPSYSPSDKSGSTTVRVRAVYDIEQNVSI